jgi:hypothetical protein
MILDLDVKSYYPNLAIRNKKAPQHLGKAFYEVYENLYDQRAQYAKGTPENYGIKISLNSVYGKSNDIYSYLYDPQFTMFITVNGQLLLTMLTEMILLRTDAQLLQANTDGVTVFVSRKYADEINIIRSEWEKLTSLELEDAYYKSMFIVDVNNYMAVTTKGSCKFKGSFEIDKMWHKDHSHRIIPIAIARACLYAIPPKDTIMDHLNVNQYDDLMIDGKPCISYGIFDFCGAVRARGGARYDTEQVINGVHTITSLPKTNRYFVSNKGVRMRKILPPDTNVIGTVEKHKQKFPNQMSIFDITEDVLVDKERISYIEAGHNVTMFNSKFEEPYDINYIYYINECNKILEKL